MYDQEEGLVNILKTKNNQMMQFPSVDFYEFNRTAMTRLQEEDVDDAIKTMIEFYEKTWIKIILLDYWTTNNSE